MDKDSEEERCTATGRGREKASDTEEEGREDQTGARHNEKGTRARTERAGC